MAVAVQLRVRTDRPRRSGGSNRRSAGLVRVSPAPACRRRGDSRHAAADENSRTSGDSLFVARADGRQAISGATDFPYDDLGRQRPVVEPGMPTVLTDVAVVSRIRM
jgi:hypothetical protein